MKSRKNGHYSVKNGFPITYYLLPITYYLLPITYYRAKRCILRNHRVNP